MSQQKWFKGNIHTHTTESDGDESPERVVSWYRRHGYDFLVLSDHNHRTLLDYGTGKRRFRRPLMIPGEEVSVRLDGGTRAVHLGAVGITRVVEPIDATGVVATLQANVNAIREAGGIAAINHPNHTWAFDHEAISQVRGAHLLEVFNGHPIVNQYGAGGRPGCEEIWDKVLSTGLPIWGVATDDSHQFKGEFGPHRGNPGRGWVMVRAPELEVDSIVDAMRAGEFYASTGIVLDRLEWGPEGISLNICPERNALYTTRFIGSDGAVLKEVFGPEAEYEPRGDEAYFRASVVSSGGSQAWTQPTFARQGRV